MGSGRCVELLALSAKIVMLQLIIYNSFLRPKANIQQTALKGIKKKRGMALGQHVPKWFRLNCDASWHLYIKLFVDHGNIHQWNSWHLFDLQIIPWQIKIDTILGIFKNRSLILEDYNICVSFHVSWNIVFLFEK